MNIQKNLTTVNYQKGSASRIKYIVIHFTSNNGDTAQSNTNYFKSENKGASAHYFVDEKEVWQCVEDCNIAWHCGTKGTYYHKYCRNANSLGVEMCSDKDSKGNYIITDATVANTISLVKTLMKKYGVSVDNVVRHYDVTHKSCPEPFVRNESLWVDFKNRLVNTESEELTLTQYEELVKLINELKETIAQNQPKVYHYTKDIPEWGRDVVQRALDKGIVHGSSDSDLNLTETEVKNLVYMARLGLI